MAGFASYDALINAWSTGYGQSLPVSKTFPSVSVANIPHSCWAGTGLPAAGGYGSVGKANGRVLTDATAGAIPFTNATSPATMHLTSLEASLSSTGTLILVDRISDVLLSHAESTGSITGIDATSRLGSGEGCQLWCEVQSAFSAASNTITFTYTNEGGTGSRTTGNIVTTASAVVNRSVNAQLWQPLQAGDKGIRSIQSITLVSGTATGQFAAALVRPLAYIPIGVASVAVARDLAAEVTMLPKIYDDSCLQWIWIPGAAATPVIFGAVNIAQN